jgi:signal transduction histidine kinase
VSDGRKPPIRPTPLPPTPGGATGFELDVQTSPSRKMRMLTTRLPRILHAPTPELRLRLRTKLVVAMIIAALVPVAIVAALASGVILSNLEEGLRDDADRQLTVALNLLVRSVERLGDETVQMSESPELVVAIEGGQRAAGSGGTVYPAPPEIVRRTLDAWLGNEAAHVPSSRLQVLDPRGAIMFDRVIGGGSERFKDAGVLADDPAVAAGETWSRTVRLVAVGDHVIVRAVAPIVDANLALRGVLVLSTPLDGELADSIKGALSADVLIGGTSGDLAVTFRSPLGRRGEPVELAPADRDAALRGQRIHEELDTSTGRYTVTATRLLDNGEKPVGIVGVGVDRGPLAATKRLAIRSLVLGGGGALLFALVLALVWSRRLGAPIQRLHRGAIAVSRGDLDHRIEMPGTDELTDLATAFNQMTSTLKDNQARLAARMREIVALHDAGRAVSSVIDLDQVSRKIVDAVARTFDVQLVALWIGGSEARPGDGDDLRPSAARARRADVSSALATDDSLAAATTLTPFAKRAAAARAPVRLERAADDPTDGAAAVTAGSPGPLVALPLDRKARVVGVLAVSRAVKDGAVREFTDAEMNLLATFADQAGAAVENAVLYQEVRGASEELERKVRLRTAELTAINSELGRALADLRETQAQLVLSERMAGLGMLVAGVAHEINSPTAAIRGSIDGVAAAVQRISKHGADMVSRAPSPEVADRVARLLDAMVPPLAERPMVTGLVARKAGREMATALDKHGLDRELANDLADLGATADDIARLAAALGPATHLAPSAVGALTDRVYLARTASTVRTAVSQIQRIVGALKSYSHLDQQATRSDADLHEGLETTLALLHHALRDIVVERRFGTLPHVPVFVDELNQVWTNLIQNAQQALAGRAARGSIAIETTATGDGWVSVKVIDDGPGVPADVLPRIFEPFFTTKPKGEGSGLGLGIARRIVAKHGGELRCESVPGRTCFEVRLPISTASSIAEGDAS